MQYNRKDELRKLVVTNQTADVSISVLYPALELITQNIAIIFEHVDSQEIRSKILALVVDNDFVPKDFSVAIIEFFGSINFKQKDIKNTLVFTIDKLYNLYKGSEGFYKTTFQSVLDDVDITTYTRVVKNSLYSHIDHLQAILKKEQTCSFLTSPLFLQVQEERRQKKRARKKSELRHMYSSNRNLGFFAGNSQNSHLVTARRTTYGKG